MTATKEERPMKFRFPFQRSGAEEYLPVNEVRKTPPCSSSDGAMTDMGNNPYAFNSKRLGASAENYRTALWTGKDLQLMLMNIAAGESGGDELHENADRLISVASGYGEVEITTPHGERKIFSLSEGYSAIIPKGSAHTVRNTGNRPFVFFSVYTHPVYRFGTVDQIKS